MSSCVWLCLTVYFSTFLRCPVCPTCTSLCRSPVHVRREHDKASPFIGPTYARKFFHDKASSWHR
ncbi:hypothetical protein V6Z11_A07G144400 [Gossypium hirsutum]